MLTEHWECVGCQQSFTKHDKRTCHITEIVILRHISAQEERLNLYAQVKSLNIS